MIRTTFVCTQLHDFVTVDIKVLVCLYMLITPLIMFSTCNVGKVMCDACCLV